MAACTTVGTHLPLNLLLAAVPLAPTFAGAAGPLVARSALSQMDAQPARPTWRPWWNRPSAPPLSSGRPFVRRGERGGRSWVALLRGGGLKSPYDLLLWTSFRNVPLADA